MEKANKIKVIRMLSLNGPDGDYKPYEEYSEAQQKEFAKRAAENASKAMNGYIRAENQYCS